MVVLLGIVLAFSAAAFVRNMVWRNNVLLWQDVVEESPEKGRPHDNLGDHYARQGLRPP
jgi:hypothetical protein